MTHASCGHIRKARGHWGHRHRWKRSKQLNWPPGAGAKGAERELGMARKLPVAIGWGCCKSTGKDIGSWAKSGGGPGGGGGSGSVAA